MTSSTHELINRQPYTIYQGVAAEDIDPKSVILKVICPELIPNAAYGAVGAGITQSTVKLQDRDGKPVSSSITSANHLVATWEGQSNLLYPPMIRKGEPVEVFKSGDQDKFKWRATGRGRDMRATDRVYIEVGATDPKKPRPEKDDSNTYSMFLDSEEQKAGIKTAKANGEAVAFSAQFDMKEGTFHISDDSEEPGNRIFLDCGAKSGVPTFQINLKSGGTIKLEGDNLFVKVPGKFVIDVGDRFVLNSKIVVLNLKQLGSIIVNAADIALNAAGSVVVTAGNVIGLNAKSTKVSGTLVTAALKAARAVKAAVSGSYKPVTIQRPADTPAVTPSNNADTGMDGVDYRAP